MKPNPHCLDGLSPISNRLSSASACPGTLVAIPIFLALSIKHFSRFLSAKIIFIFLLQQLLDALRQIPAKVKRITIGKTSLKIRRPFRKPLEWVDGIDPFNSRGTAIVVVGSRWGKACCSLVLDDYYLSCFGDWTSGSSSCHLINTALSKYLNACRSLSCLWAWCRSNLSAREPHGDQQCHSLILSVHVIRKPVVALLGSGRN